MPPVSRETSGLKVIVEARSGNMSLFVDGKRIPDFNITTRNERGARGVLIVEIPMFAITFENGEPNAG